MTDTLDINSHSLENLCAILRNSPKSYYNDDYNRNKILFYAVMREHGLENKTDYPYFKRQRDQDGPVDYLLPSGFCSLNDDGGDLNDPYPGTFFFDSIPPEEVIQFETTLRRVVNNSLSVGQPLKSAIVHRRPYVPGSKPLVFDTVNYWVWKNFLPTLDGISYLAVGGGLLYSLFGGDPTLLLTGMAGLAGSFAIEKGSLYGSAFSERSARKVACKTFHDEYLPRALQSSEAYDFNIIQKVL